MTEPEIARSYRPGEWFGIFGDHVIVVLPPSEKARVAQLWELVDEGAGFDVVLDALISDGLRELPGFVLVSESDADTKVVVRGPASVRFATKSGDIELAGSAATTWVEHSMDGVTGLVIDLGGEGAGPDLTVQNGLVRVSRIQEPPVEHGAGTGPVETPDAAARPVARLVISNGETVEVDRAVLIGRAPDARQIAAEQPRLVTVPSPQQEISSTHLEVRPGSGSDHGAAVVTDLGSTNGTVLVQPGLAPEDLQPGVAVQVLPGATLDLGDGVTIQVDNP